MRPGASDATGAQKRFSAPMMVVFQEWYESGLT
jgi:hypothetical protein